MASNISDIQNWGEVNASLPPRDILAFAFENFSPRIGISFSGAEDVVLVEEILRTQP